MLNSPSKSATSPAIETTHTELGIIFGLMAPAILMGIYISMFSVAVPTIRAQFGIEADTAAWVDIVYSLPFIMFMPLYGRLGDALGKRRLLLIGIVVFMVGTAIAATASSLGWLMAGRAIQGMGTAGFVPLSMAIITQLFPVTERGKIMGTWNSAMPLTGILAPVVGGLLIQYIGWRAIFVPVLVVGLFVFPFVRKKIPSLPGFAQPNYLRQFDWGGVILLSTAITSLLFYASSRPITGVAALRDWRLLATTLLLFSAFIIWELRQAKPFVPLKIYANVTFTLTSLVAGIRMFSMSGIRFIVPLYLAEIHGVSAAIIGIILTAHSLPLFLMIRLGGQLADKWGSRRLVVYSLLIQITAMVYLALLPVSASLWWIASGVMWQSFGAAFSLAPLHKSSMAGISQEQTGIAAGLYSMVRFAGTVFGVALSGVVLQQGLSRVVEPIEAYQVTFWFVAGVILLGALLGSRLKD